MKNVTAKEKKLAIDNFLSENCDVSNEHYSIKFYTKGKGLFSGFTRQYLGEKDGEKKYKYYGFVIDLVNKSFFVEGVSGKRLKMSATTLNALFGYGSAFANTDNIDLNMFYSMGRCYGNVDGESTNIGRGIYRGIKYHSTFEQVYKELYPYHPNMNYDKLTSIVSQIDKNTGTIKKALYPINKNIYNNILSMDLFYISNLLMYSGIDSYKKVAIITNKVASSFIDVVNQVDKQRGYHDGDQYIKNSLYTVIDSLLTHDLGYRRYNTDFYEVLDNDKTTTKGLFSYLYGSCFHQQGIGSMQDACRILKDYYNMTADFDNAPKYPRYLKTTHDVVAQNYKITQDSEKNAKISKLWFENHRKYDAIIGDYFIIDAFNGNEISEEGNNNSNCVASYANSVSQGKTNILFLRKKTDIDKSWVTLEVRNNTLVQSYGTFDADLTDIQQKLLYSWCHSRGINYSASIGGAYTSAWKSFSNLPKVLPMIHPDKYHANFKEEILNLSDNYVKIVTERDNKISKALSNVKSI